MPTPEVGEPLPRAASAFVEHEKWHGYVLAPDGHGDDWRRIFGHVDAEELWAAIRTAVRTSPVTEIRDLDDLGVTCRVPLTLTFNNRTADVRTIWHYAPDQPAPRLVTAYPTS